MLRRSRGEKAEFCKKKKKLWLKKERMTGLYKEKLLQSLQSPGNKFKRHPKHFMCLKTGTFPTDFTAILAILVWVTPHFSLGDPPYIQNGHTF